MAARSTLHSIRCVADLHERLPDAAVRGDVMRLGYAARSEGRPPAEAAASAPIRPAGRRGTTLASFAQEQFWFVDRLSPGTIAHNFSWPVRLRGQLDADALERALAEVVRRHEALRTGFALEDGLPVQMIGDGRGFALERIDVSGERDPGEAALRLVDEQARRPLDLGSESLFCARLLELGDAEHVLHLVVHHIVFDERSKIVVFRELSELYEAFVAGRRSPLPEPAIQYADFAEWQRSRLNADTMRPNLAWWAEELAGAPTALELPSDGARPAVASLRGARLRMSLPPELTARLETLAETEDASLFDAMLALFETLLVRHTREDDFLVGVPADARTRPDLDDVVGVLLNTVVVRSDVGGSPTFRTLLRRVHERVLAVSAHADLPFESLVRARQPQRDLSRHPLFQVMLAINPPEPALRLPGIESEELVTEAAAAGVDLFLFLQERTGGLEALWEYSTDLFARETIERLHDRLARLLEAAVTDPDVPIDELSMLSDDERRELLERSAGPTVEYPQVSLHRLVEAQAARTPNAIAVVHGEERVDYAALNGRANRLARRLQEVGVAPGSLVGVSLERSPDLVVGLLAILKAGGAYVPLDPDLPRDRSAFMLDDSGAAVVVTTEGLASHLPPFAGTVMCLDTVDAEEVATDLDVPVAPDDVAYVIYTSGSTGRPKGVLCTHRGIVNRLLAMQETYRLDESDRLLQKTQSSFDVSVREVFWPLIFGACIVVTKAGEHGNPIHLAELVEREKITTLHFVPSMLQVFLEQADPAKCRSIRSVLCGGEALPADLARRFRERFGCELHNLYGPTEASVSVTAWRFDGREQTAIVPIGRPVPNTQVYVLDERLEPVPTGVWGELFIGGAQVARGYHDRPDLTAERFVANPFGEGRLYRTGDLGRWNGAGAIEFGGRIDDQVKVRGFRVELGEIEAVLREHDSVAESAVAVMDDELAAYVVLHPDAGASSSDLFAFLRGKLPEYMVPGSVTPLEKLPLLPSGKLDRAALPMPERRRATEEFVPAQTEEEQALADIWSDLLGVDRVGRVDNFFALGGHSLLAARLVGRVAKDLGVELPLCSFLQEPTVAALALEIESAGRPVDRASRLPPLVRRTGVRECSFAQERFLFVDQVMGTSAAYNIPVGLRLRGELRVPLLEHALAEIVRRHEILRTRFSVEDGRPVQLVEPALAVSLPVTDLTRLAEEEREAEAQRIVDTQTQTPIEPAREPQFLAQLIRLGDRDHILHLVFSHLVFDGVSTVVLLRELNELYGTLVRGGLPALAEPTVQFADFAEWQRSWLEGDILEQELAYWTDALAGMPPALELPTDHRRPEVSTLAGAWSRCAVPSRTVEGLQALARSEGASLYMTLLAVFDVLLRRYTGQGDIVLGMPVDGRDRPELEEAIGVFVDTVVLRVDLSGGIAFREALRRVRARMLDAIAHQRLPFEKLVRAIEPERMLGRHPLYQVMLTLVPEFPRLEVDGVEVEEVRTERVSSPIDLTVFLEQRASGLEAVWEYSTELFSPRTIDRMQSHFLRLLDAVVSDPDAKIDELPLLTTDERHALLAEWSRDEAEYPVGCLHELFEARVAVAPDAPAATYEGETLSYGELNARANRLAHHLRELGVGPETLVALCLRRSLDLVVAVVAVLKAGGAYVPLDPDYPADRLSFVLSDTAAPVLLTQEELLHVLPPVDISIVCVDRDATFAGRSEENPEPLARPEHLAYVIYTSGSTGQPKGVQIEHRNVARLFTATEAWFGFGPDDTWLLFHSYAFDFSVWELWGALLHGGRLVVAPLWTARSPQALARLLVDEGVTVLNATPSLFVSVQDALLESSWDLSLRLVVFGGEALHPPSLRPWFRRFESGGPRLVNMYGITETTVHVTYRPIAAADCEVDSSPIGRPIPDLQLFVLGPDLDPVPPGVPGELFVGGAGLARSYLNRPELSAERFVPNPFGPGRLYRSGDSARYRDDGEIEFLGRIDDQVKIRGFRIELGEIQSALAEHGSVAECAVVAHDESGETRLAAYIVPSGRLDDGERLRADLRAHLEQRLPSFMVPASLTLLEQLPLTSNGKLDRTALPAPAWEDQSDATFVAPRTPTEIRIAEIWRTVLGVERIGADDNFFHIGGHSLLGARVVTQVREQFAIELSVRALFEGASLSAFAARVDEAVAGGGAKEVTETVDETAAVSVFPPSYPQQQMLFIDRLAPDVATYNGAFAVRIAGELDRPALEAALADVVIRHESLRTIFRWDDDGPVQVLLDRWELSMPIVDLSSIPAGGAEAELGRLLDEESRKPFDLGRDLMVRTVLFKLGADDHVLLVVTHHIASDGWSVGVFCRELGELYRARRKGRSAQLPDLELQYRDFAAWQRDRLRGERLESELAHWREQLAGAPTILFLPTDRPRPAQLTFDGATHVLELPGEIAERIQRVCRDEQVTPYMLLLAVFGTLLYRLTGQDDILVSGPFANRGRSEYDQLIGFLANTLVLRVRLGGNPPFSELLGRVRATTLDAFDHQEVPFEYIVDAVRPQRDPSVNPLAQVNFRVRVDELAKPELEGAVTTRVPVDPGFAAFDLALDLHVHDDGVTGELLYNTNLFDRGSIERIAGDFHGLLSQALNEPTTRLLALELPSERKQAVDGDPPRESIRRFRETNSSER